MEVERRDIMNVYAVMYYQQSIGIWQLGSIYQNEKSATAEADQYNMIWGSGSAYVITRTLQ
jgi:hypothetical protein